jgi:ketosteroid isomerase-like protein
MTPRELMTAYLAAAKRGDWDTAFGLLADDLLIHIPGRSAFAGQRFGKAAAVDYVQSVRERFHDKGARIEIRRANVHRVKDARVVEVSIFEADQDVVDELLH